jgi:hypothetical protein
LKPHKSTGEAQIGADMHFVSPFLRNAHAIFATAREAAEDCRMAILVESDGAIHMCPSADWDLECLRRHHGAAMAYGVTRSGSRVRVEARSGAENCTLETGGAARLAGLGIGSFPQYRLIQ